MKNYFMVLLLLVCGCSSNTQDGYRYTNKKSSSSYSEATYEIAKENNALEVEVKSLSPCDDPQMSEIGKAICGDHQIRKAFETPNGDLHYFMFETGAAFEQVNFVWLTNNNLWSYNSIYMDKVRIQIDSTLSDPYIKFKWKNFKSIFCI